MRHQTCLVALLMLSAGCAAPEGQPVSATPEKPRAAERLSGGVAAPQSTPPAAIRNSPAAAAPPMSDDDAARLAAAAEAHAKRLAQAPSPSKASAPNSSTGPSAPKSSAAPTPGESTPKVTAPPAEVQWVDPRPTQPKPAAKLPPPAPVAKAAATQPVSAAPATQPAPTATVPVKSPPTETRASLLGRLRDEIKNTNEPAFAKAMTAAALSLADPSRDLDPTVLNDLTPRQKEQVRQYHEIIKALNRQFAKSDKPLDAEWLHNEIERATGEAAIRVRNLQLCRRVSGFGVYEPFETSTFLAGREQPVVVYLEVENFTSQKSSQDQFQVKLSQEIVLYNESDGLAVWRQPAVEIVDNSRNRRRDFFVVQLVRLPARLSVGKYLLKVRVTDSIGGKGGSLDESSIPLQIVADQSLVKSQDR